MKYVKITYFPTKDTTMASEITFYDVISCYEAFDNDSKQFILQLPNTVNSEDLEALSAGIIETIQIIDLDENNSNENIVLNEYTSIKQLHKSYYSANTNTFRTTIYFEKKY